MHVAEKLQSFFLLLVAFLLPLQTQYFIHIPTLNGVEWQYGRFGIYLVDVIICIAIVFSVAANRKLREANTHHLLLLASFVAVLLASSIFNRYIQESWYTLLRFVEGFLFVWAIVKSRVTTASLVTAFVCGMVVVSLFGVWQFAVQAVPESKWFGINGQDPLVAGTSIVSSDVGRFLRSYGTLPHPNILGGYIACAIVSLAWIALRRADRIHVTRINAREWWWIVAGVALCAGLLFSFSRSAWLGVVVGCGILIGATVWINKKKYFGVWVKVVLSALIFTAMVSSVFVPLFQARTAFQDPHEVVSVQDRVRGLSDATTILQTKWWSGIGLSQFTYYVQDHIDADRPEWELQPVHNIFLLLATEGSVFALLAFLGVMWFLLKDGYAALSADIAKRAGFPESSLGIALIVCLAAIGMFDAYLVTLPPGIVLLFFVFGIAIRSFAQEKGQS